MKGAECRRRVIEVVTDRVRVALPPRSDSQSPFASQVGSHVAIPLRNAAQRVAGPSQARSNSRLPRAHFSLAPSFVRHPGARPRAPPLSAALARRDSRLPTMTDASSSDTFQVGANTYMGACGSGAARKARVSHVGPASPNTPAPSRPPRADVAVILVSLASLGFFWYGVTWRRVPSEAAAHPGPGRERVARRGARPRARATPPTSHGPPPPATQAPPAPSAPLALEETVEFRQGGGGCGGRVPLSARRAPRRQG